MGASPDLSQSGLPGPDMGSWFEAKREVPCSMVPPWKLEVVLSVLRHLPYYPLQAISLKLLTLRTGFSRRCYSLTYHGDALVSY